MVLPAPVCVGRVEGQAHRLTARWGRSYSFKGEKQGLCIEIFVVSRPRTKFFGAGTVLCLILAQEPDVVIPLGSFCQTLIRLVRCLLPFSWSCSKTKAGQTFFQSVILHVPKICTEGKVLAPENRVNLLSNKTPPNSILTSVRVCPEPQPWPMSSA